ncbi:hypothetical protein WMY93_030645 [Mugilogobius chulae]|uniref:Uncharacterized protein n=1 Tax=Mugilogobius chulae TaxID=88201 RepID=A0AAW0MLQ8_9GOBI
MSLSTTLEVPAEVTTDETEQGKAAECLLEAETPSAADIVLSHGQAHLENAQQVFVALADAQEGAQVVEMSMFDLLNNSSPSSARRADRHPNLIEHLPRDHKLLFCFCLVL